MPLKGALLTTMPGARATARRWPTSTCSSTRPTGPRLGAILAGLGYRHEPEANPRPTHDVFVDPGGGRIVSFEGEHPDNPRRVEVHVEVKRHLWGWVDDDDLTAALWAGARAGEVLGQPATIPRTRCPVRAPRDPRLERPVESAGAGSSSGSTWGRWRRTPATSRPCRTRRLAFPALRLAARALPDAMAALDLASLTDRVPRRLARWAATVPLDHRCGLTTGRPPTEPSGFGARWERWRPDRWRLAVAYGDVPLPVALARHVQTVIARTRHRGAG